MSDRDRSRSNGNESLRNSGRGERRGRDRSRDRSNSSRRDDEAGPSRRNDGAGPSRSRFERAPNRGQGGRGRGGRGRGRGGARGRQAREEFHDQVVTRPMDLDKRGKPGDSTIVDLKANFFKVHMLERLSVTLYHVGFVPDIQHPGIKRKLVQDNQPSIGTFLFDGGNQIYLLNELPESNVRLNGRTREGQDIVMTLRKTRTVHYTEGTFLTVLNLVLRDSMRALSLQLVGRDFYDAQAKIDIPAHRVQIWPGYITSIRQHEQDILLNCRLSHKVMRIENVLQIITDCMQDGPDWRTAACRKIIGTTVLTDYNNETYKVDDIDFTQNPDDTFTTGNGEMSFANYYESKYRLTIRDRRQPLLVVKPKARNIRGGRDRLVLLVPELCRATGITDQMRTNFQLMRDMSEHTRLSPRDNIERLNTFNRRLQDIPNSVRNFQQNKMQLDRQLLSIQGRKLRQEIVKFGNDKTIDLAEGTTDWTHDMQNSSMYKTVPLKNWYVLYPKRCEQVTREFFRSFKQATDGFRMPVEDPRWVPIEDNNRAYTQELTKIMQQDPLFIMVVVSSNAADRYAAIKRTTLCAESNVPVPVQVIVERTMTPRRGSVLSVATKVAIQINCKIGGIPWAVDLKIKGLMIIGFDVSHDTRDKKKSYGAMVASLNPMGDHGGHFFSTVNQHENGEQLSQHFGNNIIQALNQYCFLNSEEGRPVLPNRILIYRDGVGDGQIQHVRDQELNDILSKIEQFYNRVNAQQEDPADVKKPKVGFVIVNKRTNARFLKTGGRSGVNNPEPGTIVDDVITLPERYDFFMVSQLVTQGTVCPTYYNVIHEEFSTIPRPDIMQVMTFKLCHLYYNWSGTTRIPSVVQYAKKLAFMVGQYIHHPPSLRMPIDKQLYFL